MRFLHTSDWHIGKLLHGTSLIEDQAFTLDLLHEQLRGLKLDCVVISGDIYDRSIPPVEAVALFNETLTRFWRDFKKPVIIVPGNHDSSERLSFASAILRDAGICLFDRADAEPLILTDRHGDVAFCPVPYLEPAVARGAFKAEDIHTHEASVKAACDHFRSKVAAGQRSVLVSHAFVAGGELCESERPLSVGGSEAVNPGVFEGFNYVALGHLHKAQSISRPYIRYSGSPLKYSQSEKDHVKSFTVVDINEDGSCFIEEMPVVPRRDLREVEGYFKEILKGDIRGSKEDYVVVKLLDSEPILNAIDRLREVFPNLLSLERPGIFAERSPQSMSREEIARKSDIDLFRVFTNQVSDLELSEEHVSFFGRVVAELSEKRD